MLAGHCWSLKFFLQPKRSINGIIVIIQISVALRRILCGDAEYHFSTTSERKSSSESSE